MSHEQEETTKMLPDVKLKDEKVGRCEGRPNTKQLLGTTSENSKIRAKEVPTEKLAGNERARRGDEEMEEEEEEEEARMRHLAATARTNRQKEPRENLRRCLLSCENVGGRTFGTVADVRFRKFHVPRTEVHRLPHT
ncbi:hypothetical protein RUM43_003080 [Polyplax serrata]|uniref:Uncharacterized protein n=1 Tax=Polyplax serrata TaxID=468196 RepID=A0AAN8PDW7_POLSC